jgi:hypothetical protein
MGSLGKMDPLIYIIYIYFFLFILFILSIPSPVRKLPGFRAFSFYPLDEEIFSTLSYPSYYFFILFFLPF